MEPRAVTYFIPSTGIDEDFIKNHITDYVGPSALVKRGTYKDPKRGRNTQPEQGYFVTDYPADRVRRLN